ncbi:MAG TPA: hypothetical protein ENJ09_02705 [Planctomycetes bacterium]|nr:hypothetical protein [Planctomycetota bacterium]
MSGVLGLLLAATVAAAQGSAVWVPVRGPIDASTQSHLRRGIAAAEEGGRVLVLDIDTPGGGVEVTWQIAKTLREAADRGVETVAWVNERATSAGSMLTMACRNVYMRSAATIGSALPVTVGPGGMAPVSTDAEVREKTLSYCREEFAVVAEANGRPGLLAEAMVDPDVGVLVIEVDGERRLVSEREYDDMRLDGTVPRLVRTVVEQGKLLNLGAGEAVELGLADGIVDSREDLAAAIGVDPDEIVVLERTRSEDWASVLDTWSPLLLILAFVLAYVEMKIPGFGVAGILSIVCFTAVILGRWLVGLADVPHIVLLVVGVMLIAGELFLAPGTLWLGIVGAFSVFVGILWSFAGAGTGFEYALDRSILVDEALRLLATACVAMVATVALSRFLPKTPVFGKMVLDPERDLGGPVSGAAMADTVGKAARVARVGARGRALTALRPVGKVSLVDDERMEFEALASGPEIEAGCEVVVVEVQPSGRLVVEAEARA